MAVTIKLKKGLFVKGFGIKILDPIHAKCSDWKCEILPDGTIECLAAQNYSDGEHSIVFRIRPSGYITFKLSFPKHYKYLKKRVKTKTKGKVPDGYIELSSGEVDKRYAYFYTNNFQRFLEHENINKCVYLTPEALKKRKFIDGHYEMKGIKYYSSIFSPNPAETEREYLSTAVKKGGFSSWVIYDKQREGKKTERTIFTSIKNKTELIDEIMQKIISDLNYEISSIPFDNLEILKNTALSLIHEPTEINENACKRAEKGKLLGTELYARIKYEFDNDGKKWGKVIAYQSITGPSDSIKGHIIIRF